MKNETCKNCRFYLHIADGVGDCAYYPPVIISVGRQELPTVGDNNFCGKFSPSAKYIQEIMKLQIVKLNDSCPPEVWEKIDGD